MSVPISTEPKLDYEVQSLSDDYYNYASRLVRRTVDQYTMYFSRQPEKIHALGAISTGGNLLGVSCVTYPDELDVDQWEKERWDSWQHSAATLDYLAVDKNFQRTYGIGRMLLQATEEHAGATGMKYLFLKSAYTAIPFYKKFGYTEVPPKPGRGYVTPAPLIKPL